MYSHLHSSVYYNHMASIHTYGEWKMSIHTHTHRTHGQKLTKHQQQWHLNRQCIYLYVIHFRLFSMISHSCPFFTIFIHSLPSVLQQDLSTILLLFIFAGLEIIWLSYLCFVSFYSIVLKSMISYLFLNNTESAFPILMFPEH